MPKPLTAKQQYWFDHITAAKQQSLALSAYAAQHNLSLKRLYNWRWRFSKMISPAPAATHKQSAFVKVLPPVTSTPGNDGAVVAMLPNGIRLQFTALTPALLAMLQQC
jgi:hypothetical protein